MAIAQAVFPLAMAAIPAVWYHLAKRRNASRRVLTTLGVTVVVALLTVVASLAQSPAQGPLALATFLGLAIAAMLMAYDQGTAEDAQPTQQLSFGRCEQCDHQMWWRDNELACECLPTH